MLQIFTAYKQRKSNNKNSLNFLLSFMLFVKRFPLKCPQNLSVTKVCTFYRQEYELKGAHPCCVVTFRILRLKRFSANLIINCEYFKCLDSYAYKYIIPHVRTYIYVYTYVTPIKLTCVRVCIYIYIYVHT